MASRENQGLQIALILMVMLTAGLLLTTYLFYSKSETRRGDLEDARNQLATAQKERDTSLFKNQRLVYMIKGGAKTWKQMADDLANIPGDSSGDPEMEQVLKTFRENMLLYGAEEEESQDVRNYESLPKFLMSRVRDLNQQLTSLRASEQKLTQEKTQLEQTTNKRIADAEAARQKAVDDKDALDTQFKQDRAELTKQKEDLNNKLVQIQNTIDQMKASHEEETKNLTKEITALEKTVLDQKGLLKTLQQKSFEVADATITSVNQKEGFVYLDVGSADLLRRRQTFSVFDKGTSSVMQATPKGRVEVMQILGEHVAMCKIEEDNLSSIIMPGDVVFTPAWAPGRRVHFAATGLIDITGNGRDDLDLLKSLISINGGLLDDEVTVQTRYLIQGEDRSEDPNESWTNEERAEFNKKISAAQQIGVDRLSVDKLLSLMGWKADVQAVKLGRGGGGDEFKTDTEASKPPSEEASPFRKRTPPRGGDGAF